MTIKRLSLAAAISFGLLAVGSHAAFAEGIDLSQVSSTDSAAVSTVNESADQASNVVMQKQVSEGDNIVQVSEDIPQVTGKAAPVKAPIKKIFKKHAPKKLAEPCPAEPVSPACPVQEPVAVSPACPCEPAPVCAAPCTTNSGPACSSCAGVPNKQKFCEKQVYAYPGSIYGKPSGFSADPIAMTTGSFCPSAACSLGMCDRNSLSTSRNEGTSCSACSASAPCAACATGAACSTCGSSGCSTCPTACSSGAAANIPCPGDACANSCSSTGSAVSINEAGRDGFACPITINSNSSREVLKKSMMPVEIKTGAAAPLKHPFDDVPTDFWAAQIIDRLTSSQVIAGYPDQTFRPNCPVTRAEFSSLVVSGLNYQNEKTYDQPIFKDVPTCHWANRVIDKGLNAGLIAGYPDGLFKPSCNVTRAEAIVTMSKALKDCDLQECDADAILSKYCDANEVPAWAKLAVAKALKAGILKNSPTPDSIKPGLYATRAEIAAMLASARIAMGIDPEPVACGCVSTGAAAFVEQQQVIKIPTLQVKLQDSVSSHENHVGDKFVANSTECITINGTTFPAGAKVYGQIVEVVRPTRNDEGALKIAFTEIKDGSCKAKLPREILCAQVETMHKPNVISRIAKWPFTWTGATLGDIGRTVGGSVVIAANGSEEVVNNVGTAAGELFQGEFGATARSLGKSVIALVRTPIDIARTTLSGTAGLFNIALDEVAYVIGSDGTKVAQINPNEEVKVAFGCQ